MVFEIEGHEFDFHEFESSMLWSNWSLVVALHWRSLPRRKKRQPCIDRDRSEKHRWWLASSWHHARNSFNKHWVLELRVIRLRTTCRRREQIHRSSFCRLYGEDEYGRKIVYANVCVSMSVLMSEWKDISFHTFLFAVWNFHSREWCPIREISLRLHLLYSRSPWVAYHYTRVLLVVLLGQIEGYRQVRSLDMRTSSSLIVEKENRRYCLGVSQKSQRMYVVRFRESWTSIIKKIVHFH